MKRKAFWILLLAGLGATALSGCGAKTPILKVDGILMPASADIKRLPSEDIEIYYFFSRVFVKTIGSGDQKEQVEEEVPLRTDRLNELPKDDKAIALSLRVKNPHFLKYRLTALKMDKSGALVEEKVVYSGIVDDRWHRISFPVSSAARGQLAARLDFTRKNRITSVLRTGGLNYSFK